MKPVTSVNHVLMTPLTVDDRKGFVLVSRMIYASHYFRDGLEVRYMVPADHSPDPKASYLLCISRSHSESLTGFKGFLIGGAVRRNVRDSMTTLRCRTFGRRSRPAADPRRCPPADARVGAHAVHTCRRPARRRDRRRPVSISGSAVQRYVARVAADRCRTRRGGATRRGADDIARTRPLVGRRRRRRGGRRGRQWRCADWRHDAGQRRHGVPHRVDDQELHGARNPGAA